VVVVVELMLLFLEVLLFLLLDKLKLKIAELENIKLFQQEIIIEFEHLTGEEFSKKYLPECVAKEIASKKKNLSK
jgi:hypothetical protein